MTEQEPTLADRLATDARPDNLVSAAMGLASYLVAPLGRRWLHVQSVARTALDLAPAVDELDRQVLVSAAWLHDIGYAQKLVETGFHPLDGARYLRSTGWPSRVVNLVAHHSGARFEAEERGLTSELAEFELEEGPVMDSLVTADLTTGPSGQRLTFHERIAEILTRYPETDPVHRTWARAADQLEPCVERTLIRNG